MSTETLVIYGICLFVILVLGKALILPLKWMIRLLINSILGGILLYLINLFGASFGLHIGINLFTTIFVGIFGVPGLILLAIICLI